MIPSINNILSSLPSSPGVYRFWDKTGNILYVGKARHLRKRVSSYFLRTHNNPRISCLVDRISDIEVTVTPSEREALLLEINLIKSLRPPFNIVFRDDKTYPYLVFSNHAYPRLMKYRGKFAPSADDYFGPYPDAGSVNSSIQILQKIFRLRTCDDNVFNNRKRPCLLHQIGHCSAPCVRNISESSYADDISSARLFLSGKRSRILLVLEEEMQRCSDKLLFERAAQIRDQIVVLQKMIEVQHVVTDDHADFDIINGLFSSNHSLFVVNVINVRDGHLINHRNYLTPTENFVYQDARELIIRFVIEYYRTLVPPETVVLPSLKDLDFVGDVLLECGYSCRVTFPEKSHLGLVRLSEDNLRNAIDHHSTHSEMRYSRWRAVSKMMDIPEDRMRVECFDISHTNGQSTVGACVVWNKLDFAKSEYRRYEIRDITPGDDLAAMYQAISKHYSHVLKDGVPPDMIIVDGGLEQMKAAERALSELQLVIPVIAISKGRSRKVGLETLHFSDGRPPLKLCVSDEILLFFAEIRDEAHRYAIEGHRSRRLKKTFNSVLDGIDGIGPKRRQMLLNRFGSIRAIADVNPETLATVSGISHALAMKIYEALRTIR
ncbi:MULTISPECIES: excinuclease ABC subunit UvrC [Candidatus Ichthyocystis]|uniref:UvrABC system protein C n=1 Tax=Candidatus Ichthyocystis hellenicum TaxID=1561003 RepID=A0A0S4M1E8_9BURK|nr:MULTISPECIES: excinuclease ABC subunit UvrC [Ichthyocystis]CUT17607.1 Excinuclease ABC subunit C [Candidatus Ichthyocystis hellenicum]